MCDVDLVDYNSKNQNFMEADHVKPLTKKLTKNEINTREEIQACDFISNDRNVFSAPRIRFSLQTDYGLDRFILVRGFNFLFYISSFFWILFLLFGK